MDGVDQNVLVKYYLMEAIIFVGLQASGKSSFFKERFFTTHVRINLDMLKTRHRENLLLRACIEMKQPFVVDNTNPTVEERRRSIEPARAARFQVHGYYFAADVPACLRRNAEREPPARVPIAGILGTYKKLEAPTRAEGFHRLFSVTIDADGRFVVEEWADEV